MARFDELTSATAIWVNHHGRHPAVVLSVHEDSATVICGTSRRWSSEPHEVVVKPRSPTATVIGLDRETYFYPFNVAIIVDEIAIVSVGRRCPPNVFHALEELAIIAAQETRT